MKEVVNGVLAWWWTVRVRCGAHDDDAGEIGEVCDGSAEVGFDGGVVFLSGCAVDAGAVGEEDGCFSESFRDEGSRVIDV